ncbi:hypothetical protein DY000_02052287 [Brassica cretica]|uniref:Uncharacterized protein n=1 Tax=Brassica cretica TaxID=69181 RepID=A0ABQ7AIF7_BRACR|nr:hypothetical protein DY000_02052287 [Brassica cretica]
MSSLKKRDKIQNIREAGTPKSSFLTIPKRIHTISLRERLLKASENGSRTAKHPSSASWTGCTDQLTRSASWISPTRRTGEFDRASHPTRPFGELDQSACLRPILVAPPFGIRSNLLLFHVDQSHRWNFTI